MKLDIQTTSIVSPSVELELTWELIELIQPTQSENKILIQQSIEETEFDNTFDYRDPFAPKLDLIILKWLQKFNITKYKFNPDLSIDVNHPVRLHQCGLSKLPIQFNRVHGLFGCSGNELSCFDNFPPMCDGLDIQDNIFTSLHNIHKMFKEINGIVYLRGNPIQSHILGLCLIKGITKVFLFDYNDADTVYGYSTIEDLAKQIQNEIDNDVIKQIYQAAIDEGVLTDLKKSIIVDQPNLCLTPKNCTEVPAPVLQPYKRKPVNTEINDKLKHIEVIMNEHLHDVLLCQNALIDAGFPEYAKL